MQLDYELVIPEVTLGEAEVVNFKHQLAKSNRAN